jgi:hypothetical protein
MMSLHTLEDYFPQNLHKSPTTLPPRAHPAIAICTEHTHWEVTSLHSRLHPVDLMLGEGKATVSSPMATIHLYQHNADILEVTRYSAGGPPATASVILHKAAPLSLAALAQQRARQLVWRRRVPH